MIPAAFAASNNLIKAAVPYFIRFAIPLFQGGLKFWFDISDIDIYI